MRAARTTGVLASLLLLAAVEARADEGSAIPNPVRPPTAPAPVPAAPVPAAGVPTTLQEIQETFDDQEKAASRAVKRLRYDAVATYVAARPLARDAADARAELFRVAAAMEAWDLAIRDADTYLALHPLGADEVGARFAKAEALGKLGRAGEARAAYELVTRAVNPAKHGTNTVLGAWNAYANYLTDLGDLEGARAAWRGLKAATAATPNAKALASLADEETGNLDLVRREARPFPAGTVDLDGRPVSLADYRGRVLLIEFWATWCGPCTAELPTMLSAYERYHDRGFEILGVTIDAGSEVARVRQYVREKQVPWRITHAPDLRNPVAALWGVRGVPQTILVDRDGRVVRLGLRGMALVREIGKLVHGR